MIVVAGLPAHVDHGVDRRGAADHLAARIIQAAAVEARLGFGLEHPVGARIADREQIADRNVEPDPVVAAAGFQQQHAVVRIGRQAVGQHAAGRARADDDVVEFALDGRRVRHCRFLVCRIGLYLDRRDLLGFVRPAARRACAAIGRNGGSGDGRFQLRRDANTAPLRRPRRTAMFDTAFCHSRSRRRRRRRAAGRGAGEPHRLCRRLDEQCARRRRTPPSPRRPASR